MKQVILEQQVRRRKSPSFNFRAVTYQQTRGSGSSGYNANVIRHIKQKPVHTYRKHVKQRAAPGFFAAIHTLVAAIRAFGAAVQGAFPGEKLFTLFRKGFSGIKKGPRGVFSFSAGNTAETSAPTAPVSGAAFEPAAVFSGQAFDPAAFREKPPRLAGFPLAPVLVAFVALVFSMVILNWESPSLTLLLEGPAPALREDSNSQQNLAAYAGLSPLAAPAPAEEEIPLDLVEAFAWESYQVRPGDSVSKIAAAHAISIDAIIASNNIANARRLQVGETLRIPNMDGIPYTVKNKDSLSKISISMRVPLEAILDANDIQNDNIIQGTVLFIPGARMKQEDLRLALGELFIYPIRGRLTSPFGWRNDPISGVQRHHAALDLAAAMGTPVKASMDGRVSVVGLNATYGKYIILVHANGFQTMYAHLSATSVKQGAAVSQGSKIGEVGSTGYSTGPHLHFAIYKNGRALNPLELLTK